MLGSYGSSVCAESSPVERVLAVSLSIISAVGQFFPTASFSSLVPFIVSIFIPLSSSSSLKLSRSISAISDALVSEIRYNPVYFEAFCVEIDLTFEL